MQPAKPRSFFGNTLYIFLIRFFPALAGLLVMVLYARRLDESHYGIYQNFWVQYYILSTVACMGIHVFLLTYTPGVLVQLLRNMRPRIVVGILAWMILCGIVFAGLQQAVVPFFIPIIFLLVNSLVTIAESVLSVFRRFRLVAVINISYALAFVWLHEHALANGFEGATAYRSLFLYISLLCLIRLLVYGVMAFRSIRNTLPDGDAADLVQVRSLWLHMGLYDMLQVIFRWIDKFFVSLLLTAAASAIYFNGSIDIPFLPLILGAAGSAGLMQLAGHRNDHAREQHAQYTALHAGRILSCIVFPLFFFLLFFRYELFAVIFSNKYAGAVPVFLVSILSVPLRAYSFTTVLQHYHKGGIINTGAVLDLVLACVLMYPLYLLAGLPGVAFAFTITSYIQAGYYLHHTAKLLQVRWYSLLPLKNWLVKLIVFSTVFIALHYLLVAYANAQIALFLGGAGLLAVTAIAIWAELNRSKHNYGKTGTKNKVQEYR
jgi:O-antigen/teichoic acid export membrane protein